MSGGSRWALDAASSGQRQGDRRLPLRRGSAVHIHDVQQPLPVAGQHSYVGINSWPSRLRWKVDDVVYFMRHNREAASPRARGQDNEARPGFEQPEEMAYREL
jgi:hypothetical protein